MIKTFYNRFVFMLLLLSFSCNTTFEGETKIITPQEMQALIELDDVQIVDVRTAREYQDGFIKNAQNIDFTSPTFEQDILKLDKNKPVILYCETGGQSAQCAKKLKDAGFIKIYDVKGGITQWEFQGFPTQKWNDHLN